MAHFTLRKEEEKAMEQADQKAVEARVKALKQ